MIEKVKAAGREEKKPKRSGGHKVGRRREEGGYWDQISDIHPVPATAGQETTRLSVESEQ